MLAAFLLIVVGFSRFGGLDFLPGCLLGLFLKCAGEDDEFLSVEESEEPVDVPGLLHADFPEVVRTGHFLKEMMGGLLGFFEVF